VRVKREHERHLSRTGAWIDHTPLVMHHAWSLSIMRSRPGGGVVGFIDAGAPAFAFDWCPVTGRADGAAVADVGAGWYGVIAGV